MDSAKSQLIDRLKTANTVLVTVSRNPSVDQLAACIGLTLIVNKLNKHGSAVFSGQIPSTIEFLKPEDTIEKTTDSLRDFIIALDKDKADKLRYKVEDQMVRIFITPYRTSLSDADLEFSQGDFNVELIIALGVKDQDDLDQAITAHGRILHDATVASVNIGVESSLGSINWSDPQASSLCEIVADMATVLGDNLLDEQIATALLTGIVAETERFSNDKTSALTMSASSQLMAAGANQQLVATELAENGTTSEMSSPNLQNVDNESDDVVIDDNGTLSIKHNDEDNEEDAPAATPEVSLPEPVEISEEEISADEQPEPQIVLDSKPDDNQDTASAGMPQMSKFVSEPPRMGGVLTANSQLESYDPSSDPLSNIDAPSPDEPTLTKSNPVTPLSDNTNDKVADLEPVIDALPPAPTFSTQISTAGFTPPPPAWVPPFEDKQLEANVEATLAEPDKTITDLEQSVDSPHLHQPDIEGARDKVEAILAEADDAQPLKPAESLNAMPLGEPLHQETEISADDLKPVQSDNTTGLDPSLFSELPKEESAGLPAVDVPPVPPPIPVPYNFGVPSSDTPPPPAS
jgi:nanoRNase/pAp phosphatase (c-di-AMP/oligoRNAs hydrolase)